MSGKNKESTTKVEGWGPAMDQIENDLLPGIEQYSMRYGDGQGLYSGPMLAAQNPNITTAQNRALELANRMEPQYEGVMNTLEGFLDYDPNSYQNQAARDALGANVTAQFNNAIRPSIENRSTFSGQFGGPQSAVAMGSATAPLSRAIADSEVGLMNADRNRAFNAMSQAPGLINSQLAPSQIIGDVGMQQQQRSQLELNDEIQMTEAQRRNVLQSLMEQQHLLSPLTGVTQTSSMDAPGTSPLQGALGGAAVGASIPGAGWLGAGIGAGIGAIGSYL